MLVIVTCVVVRTICRIFLANKYSLYIFYNEMIACVYFFFFQAEDGIRDLTVTGVQTCALPILQPAGRLSQSAGGIRKGDRAFSANSQSALHAGSRLPQAEPCGKSQGRIRPLRGSHRQPLHSANAMNS